MSFCVFFSFDKINKLRYTQSWKNVFPIIISMLGDVKPFTCKRHHICFFNSCIMFSGEACLILLSARCFSKQWHQRSWRPGRHMHKNNWFFLLLVIMKDNFFNKTGDVEQNYGMFVGNDVNTAIFIDVFCPNTHSVCSNLLLSSFKNILEIPINCLLYSFNMLEIIFWWFCSEVSHGLQVSDPCRKDCERWRQSLPMPRCIPDTSSHYRRIPSNRIASHTPKRRSKRSSSTQIIHLIMIQ